MDVDVEDTDPPVGSEKEARREVLCKFRPDASDLSKGSGPNGVVRADTRRPEPGVVVRLQEAVERRGQPFLGICVGMQMLFEGSDESPEVPGLGLLPGRIEWLPEGVKRPQMQWNLLRSHGAGARHPLLDGLDEAWVYFVHSLSPVVGDRSAGIGDPSFDPEQVVIATTGYGGPVVAAAARDNVWGTQFHPEKSARAGLRLLGNFVAACGPQQPSEGAA